MAFHVSSRITLVTICCAAFLVAWVVPARGDLTAAAAESNLEKRSKLALENASAALKAARQAYDKGDNDQTAARAAEIQESVELSYKSLKATGKNPRKSPKWFKQAEIATRDLLRRMDTFQQEMSFMDRGMLDPVKARVQQIHDDLLLGLMEGKRK
jgi:multidrug efflux pump subunit AcrA (membrane-fusion protein)